MSNNIRGLLIPTQQAFPAGASNPKEAAFINQQNNIMNQASLINSVKGGSSIAVPQFQMQYTPVGGPGQTPNNIIAKLTQVSTQNAANNVYDGCVGKSVCSGVVGGGLKKRKTNKKKNRTIKKKTKKMNKRNKNRKSRKQRKH